MVINMSYHIFISFCIEIYDQHGAVFLATKYNNQPKIAKMEPQDQGRSKKLPPTKLMQAILQAIVAK
jgi:hypothetical protein